MIGQKIEVEMLLFRYEHCIAQGTRVIIGCVVR